MPILIGLLLAVVGFVWWSWGRRRAGDEVAFRMDRLFRRKPCRWEAVDPHRALAAYRCRTCGVAAYSNTGKPPRDCKRNLRGGL